MPIHTTPVIFFSACVAYLSHIRTLFIRFGEVFRHSRRQNLGSDIRRACLQTEIGSTKSRRTFTSLWV